MAACESVRVVIADDHPLWRRGVRALLSAEADIQVVAEAAHGDEVIQLLRSVEADVLLLDMEMPGMSGVDVARALKRDSIQIRVLALSAYDSVEYVSGLMQTGAAGYLTKDKAPELVVEAVRAVARGEGRWFVNPTDGSTSSPTPLSERERQVLGLLVEGHSNREIASRLFIAENTVRNHLAAIYDKTGTATAREAMVWAWRNGILRS